MLFHYALPAVYHALLNIITFSMMAYSVILVVVYILTHGHLSLIKNHNILHLH
jgi:hypothetical protein